jgi:hypothetical protein
METSYIEKVNHSPKWRNLQMKGGDAQQGASSSGIPEKNLHTQISKILLWVPAFLDIITGS